ncbi:MAG: hypothetical protein JXR81_04730 [Candidatus Goldbacteria bacterium]|nr:hypothetical protein [Candidatus Goldiibacteriota bacterium]
MKKLIIISILLIISKFCIAETISNPISKADDNGSYIQNTPKEEYYYRRSIIDSPLMMGVFGATLIYFNYEICADKNLTYAIICDSAAIVGIGIGVLSGGKNDNSLSGLGTGLFSLGLGGIILYPYYGIINGYVTKNTEQQIRGWLGLFVASVSVAMMMFERQIPISKESGLSVYPIIQPDTSGLFVSINI